MNIFVLSTDPIEAAVQQCDKHVPKMAVESGQMLSTAHRVLDGKLTRRPSKSGKTMVKYWEMDSEVESIYYKAVHVGHPCTVWSMESDSNYRWHWEHMKALLKEYTYRYGKTHSTETKLGLELGLLPKNIPVGDYTPFKLAMGSNPECMFEDPVKSYRAFYKTKQKRFKMDWTKRQVPQWFNYA